MRKLCYILPILTILILFSSCSESEETGEYDNWRERNQQYVDSIARLADSGSNGWSKMAAFNLVDSVESINPNNNRYIYIQKLEQGTGSMRPLYTDSVRVHYMGRLIPSVSYPQGHIFGKSYSTYVFNEETDVPALMAVNENIIGFSTAIMHMVEGDRWKIVIPYYLGYGESNSASTGIPGYSALTFDVKLARIYKYKGGANSTWH